MKQIYHFYSALTAIIILLSFLPLIGHSQDADFTADITVTCVGGAVTFTSLSTGVTPSTTYEWSFGSGASPATASGQGPHIVTYNAVGSKTVSLTIVEGTISNNETRLGYITVNQSNTITLTSGASTNIQTVCLNTALAPTITYATTGATGALFTDLPPGVTGSFNNNVITISGTPILTGNYNYTITLTGGCGSNTANGSITVNPIPTPILFSSDSDNTFCAGTSVTFTAGGGSDYTFRVNGIPKQSGPTSTYTTSALLDNQTVDVVVTSPTGCSAISTGITNTVYSLPSPAIVGSTAICGLPATTVYTVPFNAGHTYAWSVTGGTISSGNGTNIITVDWSTVGAGTVGVLETITATGCSASNTINVSKGPASVGGTLSGSKTVCAGSTSGVLTLNGFVGNILKWQYSDDLTNWVDTAYTATSFLSGPLFETTYFRAIVQSGSCAIVSSTNVTITVNPVPSLIINQPASVCAPATINLTSPAITAGSTPGLVYTYWTNAQATIAFPSPATAGAGTYYIKGEGATGCSSIEAVTVVISPKPNLVITPDNNPVCFNEPLSLTLTGQEGSVWSWINPDTTNVNPVVVYPGVGTHTFSATATNLAGCIDSTDVVITVLSNPVVDITVEGGLNACVDVPKTFTATQNANFIYAWYVNDVLQTGQLTHVFSDTITGTLPIEVKVKATNIITSCISFDSVLVNPIQSPVLNMAATKLQLCRGDQTYITLSSPSTPPVYFAWGDGLQGNVLTRGFIPTQDTSVWAEAINATGCIARKTVNITVRDTLAFNLTSSAVNQTACLGQEVTFTGPSAVSYTYQWFVNGIVLPAEKSQTLVTTFTQNAIVRLIVTDTIVGCSGSAFLFMTVKDAPVFDLGPNQQVCQNYFITLSGPAGNGYTYKWLKNTETIALSTNRVLEFQVPAGSTTLRLEVTSQEGCVTSDQLIITSKAIPSINLTVNDDSICLGGSLQLSATAPTATTVLWWDNTNTYGPHLRPAVVPNAGDSTFVYWAEALNSLGCTARDSVNVHVNALPEVPLTVVGGSNSICINSNVTIQGPVEAGYQYQWTIDGAVAGTNSPTLSFKVTKDVVVQLRVTSSQGCLNTSALLSIEVIDLPGIAIQQNKTSMCLGETVQLTINQQHISNFVWQDGLAGNVGVRTFVPESPGVFSFWASGIHAVTGCISYDTAFVTVYSNPIATINLPSTTTICQGQTLNLSTTPIVGHSYKWLIGSDSVGSGPIFIFNKPSSQVVTLQATNSNGCRTTDQIQITVEDAPVVDLGPDLFICRNYMLTLEGPENENYSYKWFVNSSQIANNTFSYTLQVLQPVTIRLEVKVGNCTTSDQITITPLEVPVINIMAENNTICHGDTLSLQLTTQNASSYVWWDGFTGLNTRTVVPVENDTTLAYWAEAINGLGCKSRDTVLVRINSLPEVPLTVAGGSNIICYNAVATVQGPQLAGHQYEWFVDDVATGTNTYQHSFVVTKDVTVKLRVTDANGCKNTNQIAIQSRNLPGILLNPDSLEVCLGNTFTLSINNQNVNSYSWFDGLAGNLLQRTFEANATGSFIYWVEGINSFGCISRDTAFITVNPLPEIFILAPAGTTVCQGQEITLVGAGQEDDQYEWYVNNLLVNNTSTYTFVAEQTTDVSLVVTNTAGCQQTDVITVNVLDAPEVNLGADLQVCEGYELTFTGPLDANHTYAWYANNTLVSTDSSYTFILTGNLILRLEVISPDGCSTSDTVSLTTLASPVIDLTPDNTEFCLGEAATLSITTNGISYIWWDGLGTNVPTRSFTPLAGDSTYAYWAEAVNALGCKSRDTALVTVHNHPVIEINLQGLANTFCYGTNATVVGPAVEGYTYQWYVNGEAAGENIDRLIFPVLMESVVKLEVTDTNGCFGSDSLTVFMYDAPGIILSPDSLDVCLGDSFTLTINPQNVVSFAWWDGLAGNLTSRTITPTVPETTYVYWAQGINSIGCISYDTAYISVHSLPEVILLTPVGTSVCQGDTMTLQTPPQADHTYEWVINGLVMSTETQLEFAAETDVTVALFVTNEFGCQSSESVDINVNITPQPDLGPDIFACLDEVVQLEAPTGTGFTYEWFLNGISTGNTTSSFEYIVADTVEIWLRMNTINGCDAGDTLIITPLTTPKVTISASQSAICLGESVTLTANIVDAVAFAWWDGFVNPTRIVTPQAEGTAYYWAEVISAANCVYRDSIAVTVYPVPDIQLTIDQGASTICAGESVTFALTDNAGLEIDFVVWNNSVTVPMGNEPVVYFEQNFTESTWFYAEMVSMNGCSVTDSLFIEVEQLPEITISNDTTVCSGSIVMLESTGGELCIWSDETGIISAGYLLEIEALETKTYYATVFGGGNLGCANTDSVTVTVLSVPVITVQASQNNVCGGTPVILSANGAANYVWSTGQTGSMITVAPLITTTYTVTGISENGCTAVNGITLTMIPGPNVVLTGLDPLYCTNAEPAVLTGIPVGGIFSGPGVAGGKFYPTLAGQGLHQVVYSYINSFGCTGSDTLFTTVVGIAESINLGADLELCPHEEFVLDAGPGYEHYFWSTGDTTRTATLRGNMYFPGTTRTITVIATLQECSVSGSIELLVRNDCYIGIGEQAVETVRVQPNPSSGIFTIQHLEGSGELQVSIFDGRATNVYNGIFEDCTSDGNQCSIDLSHLPKGVYTVNIIRGKERFVKKMVII